jgi:hypothetical protein
MNTSDSKGKPEAGQKATSEGEAKLDITAAPGEVNGALSGMQAAIREALRADVKESRLSRAEIAIEISWMMGRPISLAMIDAYMSETKAGHRFPVELLAAWVMVLKSSRLAEAVFRPARLSLATAEDRDFAELGRAELRRKKLAEKLWETV